MLSAADSMTPWRAGDRFPAPSGGMAPHIRSCRFKLATARPM
jgi:hypothetical protein